MYEDTTKKFQSIEIGERFPKGWQQAVMRILIVEKIKYHHNLFVMLLDRNAYDCIMACFGGAEIIIHLAVFLNTSVVAGYKCLLYESKRLTKYSQKDVDSILDTFSKEIVDLNNYFSSIHRVL